MSFRDRVALGRTGLQVSRLGVGAGYGVSTGACEKAFHEYGVNYFYWSLPRRAPMKRAIQHLSPTHREELVIAIQSYDHLGVFVTGSVERQLRALKLDYADVLILGWFNRYPPKRILDGALALQEQGKIRHIAMSGHHRPTFGKMAEREASPVDIFMIRYNAAHRGAETDLFPHLPEANRPGVCTYTTTCWGKLLQAKKMPPGEKPMTATECYRFALSNPNVDLCLTGPANDDEMDAALATLNSPPVSDSELERFREIGDYVHG